MIDRQQNPNLPPGYREREEDDIEEKSPRKGHTEEEGVEIGCAFCTYIHDLKEKHKKIMIKELMN